MPPCLIGALYGRRVLVVAGTLILPFLPLSVKVEVRIQDGKCHADLPLLVDVEYVCLSPAISLSLFSGDSIERLSVDAHTPGACASSRTRTNVCALSDSKWRISIESKSSSCESIGSLIVRARDDDDGMDVVVFNAASDGIHAG